MKRPRPSGGASSDSLVAAPLARVVDAGSGQKVGGRAAEAEYHDVAGPPGGHHQHLAARSFAVGPKLGGLCRRNWATIGHARAMRGAHEAAGVAHRQGESCTVSPPVRM